MEQSNAEGIEPERERGNEEQAPVRLEVPASAPHVFISYAGEDKDFVSRFATKLRQRGIHAWFAEWELRIGDTLVQRIFRDGLDPAVAVIVVLSKWSLAKDWVTRETAFAVGRSITGRTRVMPVLIEKITVPPELEASRWHRIANLDDIDEDVRTIVDDIVGGPKAPALGPLPGYLRDPLRPADMEAADWFVLTLGAQHRMRHGRVPVQRDDFLAAAEAAEVSIEDVDDSIEVLDGKGLLHAANVATSRSALAYDLTTAGFGVWFRSAYQGHEAIFRSVCLDVLNSGRRWAHEVAAHLGLEVALVEYVFEDLRDRDLVLLSGVVDPSAYIGLVKAELKRRVRQN